MLVECFWSPNSGHEHNVAVNGAFQQWQQQEWITFTSADYVHSLQALVHCQQKCTQLLVVIMFKKCFKAENWLYEITLLCSLFLL